MLDIMLHEMEGLSLGEKRELICATKAAVARELGRQADGATPRPCPRCSSSSFIRKGHNADGSQRWLCKGCGRSSSSKSRGLLAASKPDATAWALFVGPGLRQCAKTCHVCLGTSWSMRMRLCEAMERPLLAFRAGPPVSWQEAAPASASPSRETGQGALPGCRGSPTGTAAPSARGISSLKACVICGANDAGDGFCRLADRGRPGDEALKEAIEDLGPGTWAATDAHQGYRCVLPALGIAEHAATGTRPQKDGGLGMASAMHQRLRIFLAPFHGVSTKWLDRCLSWFLWLEQARRSDADGLQTLSGQSACGFYEHTRRQMIDRPQPFWDYWQRQGAATSMPV
jgi:transposase-like protein